MKYETTLTADQVLDDVELWLIKQDLLPSINSTCGLHGQDVAIYEKIEDLIKEDHSYWANCSKWSLFDYAKNQVLK